MFYTAKVAQLQFANANMRTGSCRDSKKRKPAMLAVMIYNICINTAEGYTYHGPPTLACHSNTFEFEETN